MAAAVRAVRRSLRGSLKRQGILPATKQFLRHFSADLGQSDTPVDASAQSWQGIKRFYDNVSVRGVTATGEFVEGADAEAWQVLIQGRALRTNGLNELIVPTKQLALAIAAEFASQKSTVVSATTPLYNMACMAIDAYAKDDLKMQQAAADIDAALRKSGQKNVAVTRTDDPVAPATEIPEIDRVAAQLSTTSAFGEDPNRPEIRYGTRSPGQASAMSSVGVGGETQRLREMTKDFLETDTVCYRVSLGSGDPDEALLRRRQDKYYDPLVQWWEGAFAGTLGVTEGLGDVQHPTSSYEACEAIVDAGDHFFRSALHTCLGATKSTVISMALLHGHITVEQAFAACRVEEEYQIEVNGFVEDGHDTTRIQSRIQLGAAGTLMWLSPASRPEAPASDAAGVAAQMEARLQAVAVRRSRDVVQTLLADEAAASVRARALAATGSSATDAELEDSEDAELAWMERELLALQRNSNRMAQQAGLEVPYPEAAQDAASTGADKQ